ncbi:hypothetical protein Cni_G22718 [Canna indica]|uniref:CCHC-type domain-containing protein n=1 Tax=Canna indica TaxID=4628 RepID=A0AAQ3KS23_9LILI|nr:hypothetical protein Cni_G22718 [Canna indica]
MPSDPSRFGKAKGKPSSIVEDQTLAQSSDHGKAGPSKLKTTKPRSWIALFKGATQHPSEEQNKLVESQIKAIQENSMDEVVIEDELMEAARSNWINCLYASKIGQPIKFDEITIKELRAKYARPVAFENIHKLCYSCGRMGHQAKNCSEASISKVQNESKESNGKNAVMTSVANSKQNGIDGSFGP